MDPKRIPEDLGTFLNRVANQRNVKNFSETPPTTTKNASTFPTKTSERFFSNLNLSQNPGNWDQFKIETLLEFIIIKLLLAGGKVILPLLDR